MEEWKKYKLGEITSKIGSGATPKGGRDSYLGGNIALIRSQNVLDFSFSKLGLAYINEVQAEKLSNVEVYEKDVLLNITGDSVARVCIVPNNVLPARVNQHVAIIRGNDKVDYRYLLYYLQYIKPQLLSLSQGGATRNALTKKMIEELEVKMPSKGIQKEIVSILYALDSKIELNRRINDNLEQQAQALFKSWFVDFEPFRGGEFVDSELGLIPKGWRVVSLGEVTKQITEKVGNREDVTVLSPINSGELVLSEEYFTKQVFSKDLSKYLIVNPLSFAYNPARINIGSIGLNTFDFVGCVSPVYVVFECEPNYQYFFDFFKRTAMFKDEVALRAIGGVRQSLGYNDLSLIKIIYPTSDVVVEFNNLYLKMKEVMIKNTDQNEKFISLRDSLLPKLMSGELKINEFNC
mgnify:CR=1 FL=1